METGTTVAFDPWLMAERRVRIGLRDYLGNMDGVRLLPNKHTLDLDVPRFQTMGPKGWKLSVGITCCIGDTFHLFFVFGALFLAFEKIIMFVLKT